MVVRRLPAALALALVLAFGLAPGDAAAQSNATETLVLVSPPAVLGDAVRASLAPWRVKIIVVELASGTPAELALSLGAGFVVWRDEDELVLWDATAGTGERRDVPAELDDANAAALALSIKTWMHLGAPAAEDPITPIDEVHVLVSATPAPPPTPLPAPRMRVEAATGARANLGDDGRTDLRVAVSAGARTGPIDVLLGIELGPSHPAGDGEASGDLSTLSFGAHVRWGLALTPSITIAPSLGITILRSAFSGIDAMDRDLSASATSPGLDGAGIVEWRRGRLLVSAQVGATFVPVSQELQDRNMRLVTPAHIEPAGLLRLGLIVR